jgi:Domain of unknown function (DUF4232)
MNGTKIGILAAGGLLLLAGCTGQPEPVANQQVPTFGSSTPGSEPPSTPPVTTVTPEPTTGTTAPPPPPEPGEPAQAAGAGLCKSAGLKLSLANEEGTAGTVYRRLVFTNSGSAPCTIQGFPGVSYVAGDDGHQVGPAAERVGTKGEAISLAPGASAGADVGFVEVRNYDEGVCKPTQVRGLRVYPPQETASVFVPLDGTGCAGSPPGQQLSVKTIQRT